MIEARVRVEREPATNNFTQSVARLLDRGIFAALLALFALFAIPYGAVEPWWESIFECFVFALTALWIIEGLLGGSWRPSSHRLLIPAFALVAFALAQSWGVGVGSQVWLRASADPYETRRFALKLLGLVLTGALLLRYTTSRRRLSALIHVLIGVGVASALFGILRQTTQHGEEGFLLAYLGPGEGYAQFINRNHFAFLMEMVLGLALGLIAGGGARRDRALIYVAAMIPLWTALVLANSRGGISALLGQILFLALLFGSVRRSRGSPESDSGASAWLGRIGSSRATRALLVVCLALLMAVCTIWMGGDPLVNRLETLPVEVRAASPDERASESRVEIWRATWRLIKAHPVTGVGFGAYGVAISGYYDSSGEITPREAHNDYLELLAGGGAMGGAFGVWFVIALVRSARERLRHADPFRRAACFGALTGIFGVGVHSLVDFGLHITVNAIVFTALVVIATLDVGVGED